MSLLVTIFLLAFLTELITWVGQSVLLDLVYALYLRTFYRKSASRQHTLKAEILAKRTELSQTSAQDQFAKWVKLSRSIDKTHTDLENLNRDLATNKTTFSIIFVTTIWILTTGFQLAIGWYYRTLAVFYLPPGWLGPLEWWMALPFAPKGSVSVGVWQMACRRVIKVFGRVARDMWDTDPDSAEGLPSDKKDL